MAESISKAQVMDFVNTLTTFSVTICKSKCKSASSHLSSYMILNSFVLILFAELLVVDEEYVEQILPSIAYLDQA